MSSLTLHKVTTNEVRFRIRGARTTAKRRNHRRQLLGTGRCRREPRVRYHARTTCCALRAPPSLQLLYIGFNQDFGTVRLRAIRHCNAPLAS